MRGLDSRISSAARNPSSVWVGGVRMSATTWRPGIPSGLDFKCT
jgi:hypothetical protein